MAQFCISFPPPSYQELFDQIKHLKPDFSKLENLIPVIGLPIPIYIDFSHYSNELSQLVQYWRSMLSVQTLLAMIKPMVSLLGLALDSLLPKIPFLNISILDLITMDANTVKQMIATALKEHGQAFLSAISAFLPLPIYFGLSIPSFEINAIFKAIYSQAVNSLIEIVTNLIGQVLDKLKLSAILNLPKLPTLKELQNMIMQILKAKAQAIAGELIQDFKDEYAAIVHAVQVLKMDINAIFALIQFPGLPIIKFPSPFFPDFSCLAVELREAMQIFMQSVMTFVIDKIVSFVKSVLSMLGIQFPTICIDLPELPPLLTK
jgi:hypothetical protein